VTLVQQCAAGDRSAKESRKPIWTSGKGQQDLPRSKKRPESAKPVVKPSSESQAMIRGSDLVGCGRTGKSRSNCDYIDRFSTLASDAVKVPQIQESSDAFSYGGRHRHF
jgi:hypothetical protein